MYVCMYGVCNFSPTCSTKWSCKYKLTFPFCHFLEIPVVIPQIIAILWSSVIFVTFFQKNIILGAACALTIKNFIFKLVALLHLIRDSPTQT